MLPLAVEKSRFAKPASKTGKKPWRPAGILYSSFFWRYSAGFTDEKTEANKRQRIDFCCWLIMIKGSAFFHADHQIYCQEYTLSTAKRSH